MIAYLSHAKMAGSAATYQTVSRAHAVISTADNSASYHSFAQAAHVNMEGHAERDMTGTHRTLAIARLDGLLQIA